MSERDAPPEGRDPWLGRHLWRRHSAPGVIADGAPSRPSFGPRPWPAAERILRRQAGAAAHVWGTDGLLVAAGKPGSSPTDGGTGDEIPAARAETPTVVQRRALPILAASAGPARASTSDTSGEPDGHLAVGPGRSSQDVDVSIVRGSVVATPPKRIAALVPRRPSVLARSPDHAVRQNSPPPAAAPPTAVASGRAAPVVAASASTPVVQRRREFAAAVPFGAALGRGSPVPAGPDTGAPVLDPRSSPIAREPATPESGEARLAAPPTEPRGMPPRDRHPDRAGASSSRPAAISIQPSDDPPAAAAGTRAVVRPSGGVIQRRALPAAAPFPAAVTPGRLAPVAAASAPTLVAQRREGSAAAVPFGAALGRGSPASAGSEPSAPDLGPRARSIARDLAALGSGEAVPVAPSTRSDGRRGRVGAPLFQARLKAGGMPATGAAKPLFSPGDEGPPLPARRLFAEHGVAPVPVLPIPRFVGAAPLPPRPAPRAEAAAHAVLALPALRPVLARRDEPSPGSAGQPAFAPVSDPPRLWGSGTAPLPRPPAPPADHAPSAATPVRADRPPEPVNPGPGASAPDAARLADQVYRMIVDRLAQERRRRGW